jgi:ABC-2 type transport system ATP-binding protein
MQEVEAICQRVIIIDKGVIRADEEKSNIYSLLRRTYQVIEVEFDRDCRESEIAGVKGVKSVRRQKANIWIVESESDEDIRPLLFAFAVQNNLTVLSMQKKENNLEEIFRHLTSG